MHTVSAVFVAVLKITTCVSFQFLSYSADRAPGTFGTYRSHDQSQENTIVIRSKAYNITNNNESEHETSHLKKNMHVQKLEDSDENLTEPKLPQYAIDCGDDQTCLEAHGMDVPTFKPYTQEELEKFLYQYAASHTKSQETDEESASNKLANLYMDEEEAVINVLESNPKSNNDQDKSKSASWHMLQSQKHNHPYDDHKGWVTLEPVPWAQSQIQKWEPNAKPQIPSWDPPHNRPSSHWDASGSASSPEYPAERPWSKPSYEYKPPRPHWSRPSDFPERPPPGWGGNPDIITDNRPGYFPGNHPSQRPWYDQEPYSSNRPSQVYEQRPIHNLHPQTHPAEGDGQWVLLSSTKGYSLPHRNRGGHQRALTLDAKGPAASMSSHRTVRLTVLPADNSTNTTLSHGGLLEVESTFQTVEEAQREHAAKMLRLKTLTPEKTKADSPSLTTSANRRSVDEIQVFSASPSSSQSKTAVLAAVGAGMIPATMAMLLPMVLGRRRRSLPDQVQTRLDNMLHREIY